MQRINILVAGQEIDTTPFVHGDWKMAFHRWSHRGAMPLLDGISFAFIDWAAEEMPGVEICRRLRCNPLAATCHIVMVLEDDDRDLRRRALAAGADSYLPGPLDRAAMLDYVMASHLVDMAQNAQASVALGALSVELWAHRATWKNRPLHIMPNELRLLRYFVEHPGRTFTRSQIIAALGKPAEAIDERTVDVWVGRLRRSLRDAKVTMQVRTVRSLGYVFDPD